MNLLFSSDELLLDYPTVYGVSCSMRMEKLGHHILKHSDFDVNRIDDVSTYDRSSDHETFEVTYLDDNSSFLVIRNRGTEAFFYNQYKNVDYLVCAMNEDELNEEIIAQLRKLRGVSICFALDKPNQKEILNFSQLL